MASIYARPKNGAPAVVHKAVALIAGVLMLAGMGCAAHPVGQPISQDRVLSDGWRFVRQDVAGAQAPLLDDSHWQSVDLPHTYNALDGQDGGDNYYRGPAWYRLHLPLGSEIDGRQVYLRFEGAALMAQVYVNGQKAGEHRGAFAAFCFNITPLVHRGDNVIAVRVDNAKSPDVPPLVGDFNICGGLYRNVHLLTLNPLCISPTDDASPGVYLTPVQVDSDSATVQVTVELRNDLGRSRSVAVRCSIADAGGRQVAAGTAQQSIPARGTAEARTTLVVRQPHLWNGRDDPYLYRAIVELADGGRTVDLVDQPLGLRHFRVDPNSGFYLNGRSYPLHGVCVHQDYLDRGWAIRPAEIERNYSFIDDIGCTAVRLAHYQHPEYEYALCDRKGIAVWAELALVNDITDSTAFSENAAQQLRELIKQNYNHPSIFFWSLYNELGPRTRTDWPLVSRLNELAHRLDPHRLTVAASHLPTWHPVVWVPDITAFNRYFGWYRPTAADWPVWLDTVHAQHPNRAIGISEYGAGASVIQHEPPTSRPYTLGPWHPEEWQAATHEAAYLAMKQRPWIWGTYVWCMFDFASDARHEGDHAGRNDKGLVTADRKIKKDAFYFYKAQWSSEPFVYITSRRFNPRPPGPADLKVYSNCDSVELFVNGKSLGAQSSADHVFAWRDVPLQLGTCWVQALGQKNARQYTDSCAWTISAVPATRPATTRYALPEPATQPE
ncbi:MAG: glycoside hydrolase family 2 TIM barrel-domain containing protein [Tepidisphaeraceae bacterium]